MARKASKTADSTATIGFEAKLWLAADKLRNNMDAAEYKHVVLGLIFLKYISDSFETHHAKHVAGEGDYRGANPEDPDDPSGARQTTKGSPKGMRGGANQYRAENIFWVPPDARWSHLQGRAKLPSIAKNVDDAMDALERDNPRLKGALNKNYGRADLDKHRLGELIDLIGSIELKDAGHQFKDILGRVFEYFLTQFASAEGKNGGQFYTPSCVVRLRLRRHGKVRSPKCACGSEEIAPVRHSEFPLAPSMSTLSAATSVPASAPRYCYHVVVRSDGSIRMQCMINKLNKRDQYER